MEFPLNKNTTPIHSKEESSPKSPSKIESPFLRLQKKKPLTAILEKAESGILTDNNNTHDSKFLCPIPSKFSASPLLRLRERLFSQKPKEPDHDPEKQKRFEEISKIMKGNHDIYFKHRGNDEFRSDFKIHYESQYSKQKLLYPPSYFLDVVEYDLLEKIRVYQDKWPCFAFRKKILIGLLLISHTCMALTRHPYFKVFSILLIWVNSLIFALNKIGLIDSYLDSEFYDLIIVIFFVEILLKITAQGLSFFRGWINSLDFLIVALGFTLNLIDHSLMNDDLLILSSLIVIRPLTTIVNIESFELIACAFSFCIPLLKESLMIFLFFLLIFTISGVNLFSGYLKKRCFDKETGIEFGSHLCEDDSFCEFEDYPKDSFLCGKIFENPNWDLTSFDTFFDAFLVVLQTCTLGAWNDIMILVQETFSVYAALYFVTIVISGALVLLNLILSVLKVKFSEYKEEWVHRRHLKKENEVRRYSFKKLQKMKIFIGNQGKKRALMGRSKSVFLRLRGLKKLAQNSKAADEPNTDIRSPFRINLQSLASMNKDAKIADMGKREGETDTKESKTPVVRNEVKMKEQKLFENILSNINRANFPPFRSNKVVPEGAINNHSKSLKFLPIKIRNPQNIANFPESLKNKSSDIPLLTTEIEELLNPRSPEVQCFSSVRRSSQENARIELEVLINSPKPLEKSSVINEKESKPDFCLEELDRDLPDRPRARSLIQKNQIAPINAISPKDRKYNPNSENAFPRLNHGFSFVKECLRRNSLNDPKLVKKPEEKKEIADPENNSDIDLDYDDPELPILRKLNPKYLKLVADHNRPYESSSTNDVKPSNSGDKANSDRKKSPRRKVLYSLNFSRNFYKNNLAAFQKTKTKERNLTRMLLAGRTMKKLNKMKLPVEFSIETEFRARQLKESVKRTQTIDGSSPNAEQESYFYRIQNLLHRGSIKPGRTMKRSIRESNTLSSNRDPKEQDINEIKKMYFGESELFLSPLADLSLSSSDEEEVEKKVNEATEEISRPTGPEKLTSNMLVLNLKLEHILKNKEENEGELDEAKKKRILKKARVRQEFNFVDSIEKTLAESQICNQASPPLVFWSVEDIYGYDKQFYQYSNDGVHIVKKLRKLIKDLNYTVKNYDIWEAGIKGKWNFLKKNVGYFVDSDSFMRVMLFFVFLNTIILSINGIVELDEEENERLSQLNTLFTCLFTAEVVLKIIGMGPIGYFRDKFNIFDCFIVVISLIEWIVMNQNRTSFSAFRALSFFRTIRILRVSRLLRSLKYANLLAKKISDSLQSCLKITLILLIFIYIYALLGMAIYQGKFVFTEIRQNFENLQNSLIIVFQLITISNWNSILYGCLRTSVPKVFSMLYLGSAVFIGNYILLNLLLAILLDVFAKDSSSEVKVILDAQEKGEDVEEAREKKILENLNQKIEEKPKEEEQIKRKATSFKRFLHKLTTNFKTSQTISVTKNLEISEDQTALEKESCEKSYDFFSRSNPFRILCSRILSSPFFEFICHFSICLSLIQLILYTYVYDSSGSVFSSSIMIASFSLDLFITSFFLFEFLLQSITHGCFEYWKSNWAKLNSVILGTSMLLLLLDGIAKNSKFMAFVRPFRIIVVLRAFSYNETYRTMINALLQSIKAIMSLVFMILLIWLMFAIMGVGFLQGKMGYCEVEDHYHISRTVCEEELHSEWKIHHNNFDNILNGLLTLFVLSFFEGFPVLVYDFLDAADEDTGPIHNNSQYMIIYFVIFAVVSAIFLMNLFICVIFMHYIMAEKKEKEGFLSDEQCRWISIQRLLVKENPDYTYIKQPDPNEKIALFFYQLTRSKKFEIFIFLSILLNTIAMAMYYEGCPRNYQAILRQMNLSITIIFIVEACLKVIAMGFGGYFYSGWNKLDFFVVLTSIFDIWLEFSEEGEYHISQEITRGLRVLKVTRLLRLIKSYPGLQKLFLTSVYSLPYLINAFAILFLVYFMFTVLAVFLFRGITEGEIIDEKWVNFASFFTALLNLLRLTAGEDWHAMMYDTMNHSPNCVPGHSCGNSFNFLFFVAFIISVRLIMFNIFVLIVLQQFEENYICSDNPLQHYNKDISLFKEKWVQNTLNQHGLRLNQADIIRFFLNLPPPLGFDFFTTHPHLKKYSKEVRQRILLKLKKNAAISIMNMDLYSDEKGYLYFNEVLFACIKRAYYENINENSTQIGEAILKLEEEKNQRKISRMKEKLISRGKSPLLPYKEEKKPINPLLGLIMATICFKAWVNFCEGSRTTLEKSISESEDELNEDEGSSSIESDEGRRETINEPI